MPTTAPATASSEPSNLLLAMLDATSLSLLEPHLRDITLKQYDILQDADAPIQYVYFPVTAMISLLAILETGEAIEIAAIGREGAVGTKFGARPQLSFARAVVQLAGTALRIDICQFHQAATRSSAIADLAMSANDVLVANLQQSAACNAIHGLEACLARWLLHARDRHDFRYPPSHSRIFIGNARCTENHSNSRRTYVAKCRCDPLQARAHQSPRSRGSRSSFV